MFIRPWSVIASLLIGLLLVLVTTLFWVLNGYVSGRELCPHTFQTRQFRYWQPTFFTRGIQKVETVNDSFSVALSLTNALPPAAHERWDLAEDNQTSSLSRDLAAGLLLGILERQSGGEYDWIRWTTRYPEHAARLWPLVRQLAVDRLYPIVPEVFAVALAATADVDTDSEDLVSVDDFERRLVLLVQSELRLMLEEAKFAGNLELEDHLTNAATRYGRVSIEVAPPGVP